jgi:carbon-monoxide dehydrogenase medium subunit
MEPPDQYIRLSGFTHEADPASMTSATTGAWPMTRFEYCEPATLDEAVALLREARGDAAVLAGGTDLLVQIRERVRRPAQVVNIKKILGLDAFTFDPATGLTIGALATTRALETSDLIRRHYAGLHTAVVHFASIQVRERATIVGNVCRASPSADTLPPLICDGATLRVLGPQGARTVELERFFTGPGRTLLRAGELVTQVHVPAPAPRTGKVYLKHGRRVEMELATVGVAASVTLDAGGALADARIALAAVAPTPLRAHAAEAALQDLAHGRRLDARALDAAADAAASEARPIADVRASAEYRREMVRVHVRRALERAHQLAQEPTP